jgi:hypothetical protein
MVTLSGFSAGLTMNFILEPVSANNVIQAV